jgi:bifunctional DNA-binding transcriptional regulator/antitoxin component of YhaV-PrlF toxin-antitoxin module
MAAIFEETSTITAKGQTTVPKAVRQALGVDYGGKIAYRIEEGRVPVHNPEAEHHDPTLAAFLGLTEYDIAVGRNVRDRSGHRFFPRVSVGFGPVYTRIDTLGAGSIFEPNEVA